MKITIEETVEDNYTWITASITIGGKTFTKREGDRNRYFDDHSRERIIPEITRELKLEVFDALLEYANTLEKQ